MDYYSSVIIITLLALAVLSILVAENDRIPRKKKSLFIACNVLIALSAVAECGGVHIGGKDYIPKGVLAAMKAADYTLTPMTGGALIAMMQESGKKNRLLWGLFIGNAVMQIAAAFKGWMVVIDDQNRYTHGPLYPVYMALYSLVIIIFAVQMLSYGKRFRKQNRGSLYAAILLIFIGIGMQELLGQGLRVAYLTTAFGAAFLYIHYAEFYQLRLDEQVTEQQEMLLNDPLTGVLSRFAYEEETGTYDGRVPDGLAVFMVDINGLKAANDSAGHEAGDELICGAAACIEATVGRGGQTFRIGGDEFVVLATMTRDEAEAALRALKDRTESWSGERVGTLSLSAGCALAEEHRGLSVEALVKEADKEMYRQKEAYYRSGGHDRRSGRDRRRGASTTVPSPGR